VTYEESESRPSEESAPEPTIQATPAPKRSKAGIVAASIAAATVAIGIYGGIRSRAAAEVTLTHDTAQEAAAVVQTVNPNGGAPDQDLVLPGQTVAFTDTPIYARTSGYLKHWYFDIGSNVHTGDLLAQIETPELDAQLSQARADLQTAQANARLAGITAHRTETLLASRSVSTQERDNAAGTYSADQAIIASRQAEVARLEELQSYEKVFAPFDGIITARNTDVGDLINAGAGSPTTELFHMAATATLRIYVAVPELNAPAMHEGAKERVTVDEYPGQIFEGTLARTNGSINAASRTLLVEVDVDNKDGKLLPGAYAFVHFTLPGEAASMTIPANTLLFRSEGLRVGVVRNGSVKLVPITIGRDYGDRVEVLSGLAPSDQIILNPSDSLIDGAAVRLAAGKPAGAA
jgi:RND family efflux transporter MFP subunit